MPGRIVLLVTSPRLPAGLLTAAAWDAVRAAPVFTAVDGPQAAALRAAGVPVTVTADGVADLLAAGTAVWLAGPGGDEDLARALGLRLASEPGVADLELMYGSWDPPGARLLDVVTVMDRLASPGGDPWKLAQTHRSLAKFMLEEAYEAYDAIEADDHVALREELGDVLLQVVLHARLAEDLPDGQGWSIDDVAGDLVDKLIRRNPHVFGAEPVEDLDEITEQWERIKKAEKGRTSVLEGIAWSQPALTLAAKILSRVERAGLAIEPAGEGSDGDNAGGGPDGGGLGSRLLRMVADSPEDAEAALRRAVTAYAERVRAAERTP
ncbi:MAG TPA: MazG family protein [Rugosimonospora sp.]|jgi:XTP/dITP diphosphohydrolase